MDNYILINDLIEGNLDPVTEEMVFMKLSSDEDLRMDFKQILSVNSSIKTNKKLFDYSENSKKSIFAAIGLSLPGATLPNKLVKKPSSFLNYLTPKLTGILTSLVSAIIGGFIVFTLMDYTKQDTAEIKNVLRDNKRIVENKQIPVENIQSSNLNIVGQRNIHSLAKQAKQIVNFPIDEEINTPIDKSSIQQESVLSESSINSTDITFNSSDYNNEKYALIENVPELQQLFENPEYNMNDNVESIFSSELRNNFDFHIPGPTIEPAKYLKYNNIQIAIYYHLSEKLDLGLGIRQENFYMEYSDYSIEGLKRIIQQQPNFTSYDIILRTNILDFSNLKAGIQTSIGANNVGAIGRIGVNFYYTPSMPITLFAGTENSWLIYYYNNQFFNSKKIGVHYGFLYNF